VVSTVAMSIGSLVIRVAILVGDNKKVPRLV